MTDSKMLGSSGFERNERDLYETEPAVTEALVAWLLDRHFLGRGSVIAEPACGRGAMVRVLGRHFDTVVASDIVPLMEGAASADFLQATGTKDVNAIITNPPFGKDLDRFIAKALELMRADSGPALVAFVARSEVNHATTRRRFFGDCPEYLGKLLLTWRPRWKEYVPGDDSPRHNYAVYLWGRVGCYTGVGRPFEGFLYRPAKQGTMPALKEVA